MKKKLFIVIRLLLMSVLFLALATGCKKKEDSITVTDIDGNVYNTVTIGTQVWFKENLRTTSYNDGTDIPNITGDDGWQNTSSGAYCWYDNDMNNKGEYGALYNWYAGNTAKLCPTGWHVPTHDEFIALADNQGGWRNAGAVLKETGLTHWKSPNEGATNFSDFTGLPGGTRVVDDYGTYVIFQGIGYYGNFWTATQTTTYINHSPYWELNFDGTTFNYGSRKKTCGFQSGV